MKSNFTFKHLDHSQSLMTYTKDKIDEIGKFLLKEGSCNVYYSKMKHEFVVEFSINTKEKFFKATASAPDIYVSVDLAIDKLEKQFLKTNKINKDHKKFDLSKEGQLKNVNDQLEYKPLHKKAA